MSPCYSCWSLQILALEVVLTSSWTHRIRRLNSNKTPTFLLQPDPRLIFFIKITHNVTSDSKHHSTQQVSMFPANHSFLLSGVMLTLCNYCIQSANKRKSLRSYFLREINVEMLRCCIS